MIKDVVLALLVILALDSIAISNRDTQQISYITTFNQQLVDGSGSFVSRCSIVIFVADIRGIFVLLAVIPGFFDSLAIFPSSVTHLLRPSSEISLALLNQEYAGFSIRSIPAFFFFF